MEGQYYISTRGEKGGERWDGGGNRHISVGHSLYVHDFLYLYLDGIFMFGKSC